MTEIFEWDNVSVIGKGGSSTVFKAVLKPLGEHIAVKQIDIDGMTKDQINGIKGEIETIKTLSHSNIISYIGTQQTPGKIYILLEFADHGSLRQQYAQSGPFPELEVSYCLRQILSGLHYLHSNGIAHRDIKCANCLVSNSGIIKLADFGASKRFESDSLVSGLKGTPHWMAPEVIKGTQMTTGWMKADVWSLGCTVVELFTGRVPYAEYENPMTAMYRIAGGEVPSLALRPQKGRESEVLPPPASELLLSFILQCCAAEPADRPTVEQLQTHPFVTQELGSEVHAAFLQSIQLSAVPEMPLNNCASSDDAVLDRRQAHSDMFRPDSAHSNQSDPDHIECVQHSDHSGDELDSGANPQLYSSLDTVATFNKQRNHHQQQPRIGSRSSHGAVSSNTRETVGETRVRHDNQQQQALTVAAGVDAEEDEDYYGEDEEWAAAAGSPGHKPEASVDQHSSARSDSPLLLVSAPSRCQTQQASHANGAAESFGLRLEENGGIAITSGSNSSGFKLVLPVPTTRRFSNRAANGRDSSTAAGDDEGEESFGDLPTPCMHGGDKAVKPGLTRYDSGSDLRGDSTPGSAQPRPAATNRSAVSDYRVPSDISSDEPSQSVGIAADGGLSYAEASAAYNSLMAKYSPRGGALAPGAVSPVQAATTGIDARILLPTEAALLGISSAAVSGSRVAAVQPNLSPVKVGNKASKPTGAPKKIVPDQSGIADSTKTSGTATAKVSASSTKFGYSPSVAASSGSHHEGSKRTDGGSDLAAAQATICGVREDVGRPLAPYSGEKLRIHTTTTTTRDGIVQSGGSKIDSSSKLIHSSGKRSKDGDGAVLEKLSRSGAGAIRKGAALELREAAIDPKQQPMHSLMKIKPSVQLLHQPHASSLQHQSHHHLSTTRPSKRSRTERLSHIAHVPPPTETGLFNPSAVATEMLRSAYQDSVRSQSAGVTLSCEGGGHLASKASQRHKRLPPMNGSTGDGVVDRVVSGRRRGGGGTYVSNNEDSEHEEGGDRDGDNGGGRYIQTAPAVSRSVNLPPIKEAAAYTSQTPKGKQQPLRGGAPRLGAIARLGVGATAPPLFAMMKGTSSSVDLLQPISK